MCRTQCVLALAALFVRLVHSWDIAISQGHELIFYTNGSKTDTVNLIFHNLTSLAYDDVHDIMFYVNKQCDSDAICGYNLHSKEDKCFIKRNSSNIHSIAFDPVTDTLFFTDTNERSINWISMKPGSINNVNGNLLIKMDDRTPTDIAVDSCGGYIYWINTNIAIYNQYMERVRFDGSEREVINLMYQNLIIYSLALDPQTRKIYYFLHTNPLMTIDFDGYSEDYILYDSELNSGQKELTVTNYYIYWISGHGNDQTIWQIPKNANKNVVPNNISTFSIKSPLAIAANYKIKDKIQGSPECEALSSIIPTITEQKTESTSVAELFCVHGKVSETSVCKCTPGYTGERCEVSVCENYCLHGNCSFNDEGLPKCRCTAGYSGERCEVSVCHSYCLNNGECSLNEEDEPVCQCVGNHKGSRCEAVTDDTFTYTNTLTNYKNVTLADLLSNWRKLSVVIEK